MTELCHVHRTFKIERKKAARFRELCAELAKKAQENDQNILYYVFFEGSYGHFESYEIYVNDQVANEHQESKYFDEFYKVILEEKLLQHGQYPETRVVQQVAGFAREMFAQVIEG